MRNMKNTPTNAMKVPRHLFLLFVLNLSMLFQAQAGKEIFNTRQAGNKINNTLTLYIIDDKYDYMRAHSNWSDAFANRKVTNKIVFSIDPYGKNYVAQDFTAKVRVEMTYDVWDNVNNGFVEEIKQQELEIQYKVSGPYKDKNTFTIKNGGHRLRVKVMEFTTSPSVLNFMPNISLEAEIEVERYYTFDPHFTISSTSLRHNGSVSFVNGRNELLINWDPVPGAEEYDLEWAYISNFNAEGQTQNLTSSEIAMDPALFRLNSTRITTSNTFFLISLIFEPGFIVYRLRPVGRDPESDYQQVLPGSWSKEPSNCLAGGSLASCMSPHIYLFEGLSVDKNWQSSLEFREKGKDKVNITYFDGSLRTRQQQTRLNTTDKVLVSETIYDHQGRAAIHVLPVPENKQNVNYSDNFNRNSSGAPYTKEDFEPGNSGCELPAPMQSELGNNGETGASNYYSSNNQNQSNQQAFLPNANGYPFLQTKFTLDNTGRTRAQSGLGKDHKIGSGHETKFYYGQPFQEELDRLFGLDIGYDKNYKKNVSIDPNGQSNVTYLDAQGKVVATALAGASPLSMEALPGSADRSLNIDLLSKNNPSDPSGSLEMLSADGKTKILNRNYLATSQGPRDFKYDLLPGKFETQCEVPGAGTRCYNCVVEVTLHVKDECANEIFPAMSNGTQTQTVGVISSGCTDSQVSFTKNATNLNLNVGSYQISKVVTINQRALDEYTANFLDSSSNPCVLTFDNFFDEEMLKVDTSGCGVDCEKCLETIGVFPSWDLNDYNVNHNPACAPCLEENQYNKLISTCDRLCKNETVTCETALEGMLSDVSVFGQYGGVIAMNKPLISDDAHLDSTIINSDIDPSKHDLSVFNVNNKLPTHKGTPEWKHPKYFKDPSLLHYYNEKNEIDSVEILVLSPLVSAGPARFLPDIDAIAKPSNALPGTIIKVEPQYLVNVKDFIAQWKSSWAQSLVMYHPEFCYYEICLKTQASHEFDTKWLSIDHIADAQSAFGFGTEPQPLADTSLNALDPYFNLDLVKNPRYQLWEYRLMKYRMQFYIFNTTLGSISIWKAAHIAANCPNYLRSTTSCPNCLSTYDGINTDEEWIQFRSMYLSLKQNLQDYKTRLETIEMNCFNGCIGVDNFDPSIFKIYDPRVNDYNFWSYSLSPYFIAFNQTCSYSRKDLFKDKTKRFPTSSDMMNTEKSDKRCYEEVSIPLNDGTPTSLNFPNADELSTCPEGDAEKIKELEERADRIVFETCGQCPLARDLQFILDAIARESRDEQGNVTKPGQLTEPNSFNLSCFPSESVYKEFTPDLETALGLSGTGLILWDQSTLTSKRLDAVIRRQNGSGQCTISLVIPNNSPYNISDIKAFCCLMYKSNPQLLPFQSGRNFTIEGIVNIASTINGTTEYTKVEMEGISCVDISTCPMPPACEITSEGEALESLFDALISESITSSDKFVTNGSDIDIFSPTPGVFTPYSNIIRGVLDDPATGAIAAQDWVWNSTLTGNQLTAYIKDKNSTLAVAFDFFLPNSADYTFTDIIEVNHIEADRDNANPEHGFKLMALVLKPDGTKVPVTIKGFSYTYQISNCVSVTVTNN